MHTAEFVIWAHQVHCRRCGRQSTVIITNQHPSLLLDEYGLRQQFLTGESWAMTCESYVVGRHIAEESSICGHPRYHHGVWDTRGDHFIEGSCRDCHCTEFTDGFQ